MQENQRFFSLATNFHITPRFDCNKWVNNLSSPSISDAEMSLLEKGLIFEVTPPNIPTTEIVIKVESAITKLVHEKAETTGGTLNSFL